MYERGEHDYAFSILWDDLGQHVRHVIDFHRFHVSPEEGKRITRLLKRNERAVM